MATDLIMNGVTFNGTPIANLSNPRKPSELTVKNVKVGAVHVKADGSRVWIQRLDGSSSPINKKVWLVGWPRANELTRDALRTLNELDSTWTFTDQLGASYTVQTEAEDLEEEYAGTGAGGEIWYSMKLTVREA